MHVARSRRRHRNRGSSVPDTAARGRPRLRPLCRGDGMPLAFYVSLAGPASRGATAVRYRCGVIRVPCITQATVCPPVGRMPECPLAGSWWPIRGGGDCPRGAARGQLWVSLCCASPDMSGQEMKQRDPNSTLRPKDQEGKLRPGPRNRGSAATRPRISHQEPAGGHTGHGSLPSRTHQPGPTRIPVGATLTGLESGECDADRNAFLVAGGSQHLSSYKPPDICRQAGHQSQVAARRQSPPE